MGDRQEIYTPDLGCRGSSDLPARAQHPDARPGVWNDRELSGRHLGQHSGEGFQLHDRGAQGQVEHLVSDCASLFLILLFSSFTLIFLFFPTNLKSHSPITFYSKYPIHPFFAFIS